MAHPHNPYYDTFPQTYYQGMLVAGFLPLVRAEESMGIYLSETVCTVDAGAFSTLRFVFFDFLWWCTGWTETDSSP